MRHPVVVRVGLTIAIMSPALLVVVLACSEAAPRHAETAQASATVALLDAPDESFVRGPVTINYRSIGTGDPILFVHGYGDNLKMWAGLADSLATQHRVIAMDTRGFGRSSKPAGVASYGQAMVDDMVALLDHIGAGKAHVVGYSMGALLAAELALGHPDRVRTATLAAGGFQDRTAMRAMTAPWIADLENGRRLTSLLKQIVPVLPDSTVRAFSDQLFAESDSAALVDAMKGFEALSTDWQKAASSTIPAVVIVGVDDPLRRYSRDLAARWPGAKLVELPATDHMTVFSAPQMLEEIRVLVAANPRP
jgi:pimeloyl-ACP methyl ester carboxylesterase